MRIRPQALHAALAATALTLALAPAAQAGSAGASGNLLLIGEKNSGEQNQITVTRLGGVYRFTEVGAVQMRSDSGCMAVGGDSHSSDCPAGQIDQLLANPGVGDDTLNFAGLSIQLLLLGDEGNDTLTGGSGNDQMAGNPGNDTLFGSEGDDLLTDGETGQIGDAGGNDSFVGGSGNDTLDGGALPGGGVGADSLDGGTGTDTADYSRRTGALTLTEGAGNGNDGEAGEGDTLVNAETILAGAGADDVTGASEDNRIEGRGGDDHLAGGGGADTLVGGPGADVLDGGAGGDEMTGGPGADTATYATRIAPVTVTLDGTANDGEAGEGDNVEDDVDTVEGGFVGDSLTGSDGAETLRGNAGGDTIDGLGGDDRLEGGDGADTITGGTGVDSIDAGDGADTIAARDGTADTITCGPGADTVTADASDIVAADCEVVDRPTAGAGNGDGGGGSGPDTTPPVLVLPGLVKLDRGHALLTVAIGCPAAEPTGCHAGRLAVTYTPKRAKGSKRRPKARKLKAVAWSASGGDTATVTVALAKRDVTAIRAVKKVALSTSASDAAGNRGTAAASARAR
ncbi:MAG: hypothetical protein QOJ07_315 [Thermoleophilaceae bacterium]|nr:hypothetical protein [Thermoleophilaceae bacterium]